MKFLTSAWFVPVVGAVLYLGTTMVLLNPARLDLPQIAPPAGSEETSYEIDTVLTGEWDFHVPEISRLIDELKKEKEAVAQSRREAAEMQAKIAAERQELDDAAAEVRRLQGEFNQIVTYVKQEEEANLRRVSKTYAAMKPVDAANILKEMDDDWIVRVLMFMTEDEIAGLLSELARPGPEEARRAAELSERMRLTVQEKPAGRNDARANPARNGAVGPLEELAALNGSPRALQGEDFRKLARGYAGMGPQQAARVLSELQDDQVARILAELTEEETASILIELSRTDLQGGPGRAAHIARLLAADNPSTSS